MVDRALLRSRASLSRAGPAANLVLEDEGVEEVLGGLLLLGGELADGFELELEVFVGPASVGAEGSLVTLIRLISVIRLGCVRKSLRTVLSTLISSSRPPPYCSGRVTEETLTRTHRQISHGCR